MEVDFNLMDPDVEEDNSIEEVADKGTSHSAKSVENLVI